MDALRVVPEPVPDASTAGASPGDMSAASRLCAHTRSRCGAHAVRFCGSPKKPEQHRVLMHGMTVRPPRCRHRRCQCAPRAASPERCRDPTVDPMRRSLRSRRREVVAAGPHQLDMLATAAHVLAQPRGRVRQATRTRSWRTSCRTATPQLGGPGISRWPSIGGRSHAIKRARPSPSAFPWRAHRPACPCSGSSASVDRRCSRRVRHRRLR